MAGAAVLMALLAVGYAQFFAPPVYSATAKMHVTNSASKDPNDSNITSSDLTASQTLVKSYKVIMETPETLLPVIEKTGNKYTYDELLNMISSGSVNNTEIFYIRVEAYDPEDAALIANTICEVLPERINATFKGSSTSQVQEARVPDYRSTPVLTNYALIGAIIGLALSCLAIVATEMMDRVIRDEDYPTNTYGVRTLAAIPDLMGQSHSSSYSTYEETTETDKKSKNKAKSKRKWSQEGNYTLKEERKILCDKLQFHAAEAYKMLRTNLLLSGEGCQVIGVTSSSRNDGKSTMTINLAYTLAQSEKSILLIEADLRKPVVAKRLMLVPEPGLSDLLSGKTTDVIQPSGYFDNWKVMCAGTLQPNPSELLSSQAMVQLLQELRGQYDIILVDLPPVNEVTDALAISESLDSMLMVVRQNSTTKPALESGMNHMAFTKTELAGFVVTNTNYGGGKYGYYGAYGRYGHYGRYGRYGRYGHYGQYGYYGHYSSYGEKPRSEQESQGSQPAQGSNR